MGLILQADDLTRGMFVTVLSVHERSVRMRLQMEADGEKSRMQLRQSPPVPLGTPLEIRGVSLPFVLCGVLIPGEPASPIILDIREVKLSRLSSEFVEAVDSFAQKESEEAAEGLLQENSESFDVVISEGEEKDE